MKLARSPLLVLFIAAVFLANATLAAARACTVALGASGHGAIEQVDASAHEGPCPGTEGAARCLTHFTQNYNGDEQKYWTDAPGIQYAAQRSFLRVRFGSGPAVHASIPATPVGPPLTILFGNLRI